MGTDLVPSSTVPLDKPGSPVLADRMPAYVWKTGKTFFLSKREHIVAETFLKTWSYAECERALKAEGFKVNWLTCKRWMEKPHIKEWMGEQVEERGVTAGWTEGRWLKVMTDHLRANAEYEAAKDEVKMYEGVLARKADDSEAVIGLTQAKAKMKAASVKRLAMGDLYCMKLIASVKGFESSGIGQLNVGSINFTQNNGKA